MNFGPKPKLQGFEKKTTFMLKYFQAAKQKVKKKIEFELEYGFYVNSSRIRI